MQERPPPAGGGWLGSSIKCSRAVGGPAAVAIGLSDPPFGRTSTAHERWPLLHGGHGSISLEYQTFNSAHSFTTLVAGLPTPRVVLYSNRCPFLDRDRKIMAYFGVLLCTNVWKRPNDVVQTIAWEGLLVNKIATSTLQKLTICIFSTTPIIDRREGILFIFISPAKPLQRS